MNHRFNGGGVPVSVAAKVYGKDPSWVRAGIIAGWLPIGTATRNGELVTDVQKMDSRYGRINYYISPVKLYNETGFVWSARKTSSLIESRKLDTFSESV